MDAIGKRTTQVLFREFTGKELLFPAYAHHGAGHAGPCSRIRQAGLGAIDRCLNTVVPKARHGKGKLARARGATLKGLVDRHAIKGARRMVCVGKGGLVSYGLVRIGRACGVLVHGHARLAILRGVLGDVEGKGACTVERHGRGGFGAKGK